LAESLLITGPPASGKSRMALDHFRAGDFQSGPGSFLITPTATMAEHIRHELARALTPVRPSRIITLAAFLNRTGVPAAASKPELHLAIEEALERLRPARFQTVAEYRGFRNAVASLMEEVEREALDKLPPDLAALYEEVELRLSGRGAALRNARLLMAAGSLAGQSPGELPCQIVFDGFFSFSNAELSLIESLAARTRVVVTLPEGALGGDAGDWPGAAAARSRLLRAGFREQRCARLFRMPEVEVFCAPTLEQEIEEIARRILEEAARGRPFHEMGIVLRTRDPYAPALKTTLARFGIPARFYFAEVLAAHPAVAFLAGAVRALLSGWDHADVLRLVRMPVSGAGSTPEGDLFDFELRERLPGRGLPFRGLSSREAKEDPPGMSPVAALVGALLDAFAAMNAWTRDRLEPAEWAVRVRTLRALIPQPVLDGNLSRSVSSRRLDAWASTASALDAFEAVLDETAALLGKTTPAPREAKAGLGEASRARKSGRITLNDFWQHFEAALELKELRLPDHRRDVVHVFDVFEARQWELPVVFVCGMNERHFPQYHREDPLLNDAARRKAGLKTSGELQREERSLFHLATARATGRTVVSYARFDEKGDATLPSFFIDDLLASNKAVPCDFRVRPRPSRTVTGLTNDRPIQDPELLKRLATTHLTLSPSSVERFLQCPFQFFADRTLRLRPRPAAPRDRLDALVQGSIIHAAIAALEAMPLLGAAVFDHEFEAEIAKLRIPSGYRTEAVRLEMLRNFTTFLAERSVSMGFGPGWPARVEEKFRIALTPHLSVRGRIDRLEVGPNGEALVIDYKYSAPNRIRDHVKNQDKGEVVQAGLYLLAAVKEFGLTPAGMLYCGLKKEVEWGGWHVPLAGLEKIGECCTRDRLGELTDAAAATTVAVSQSIASGEIGVRPADERKCAWCDYRDICRIETH
jgi:ATP-dependent helicase/DNAse subunit B